ncbi:RluA family pseudouridine synthase [Neptunomonas sp. XY-337]|uniref:RluA family pseudouridine synthase n=1 Tax=Neptunomonas sp. XY-337 TaxID=2561897 RepID=UPI0010A9D8DE|nr:RluA family pseudouridine synthase [Neptunomonas sp. XY-337]
MIPVLYEDEHLIVVVKPDQVLSVPGKGPDKQNCLGRRVRNQSHPTARIVHRLDYATSGVMVMALTAQAHAAMSQLFQQRQVSKRYQAIISGHPTEDTGVIEQPLRCDWERRPLQIVDPVDGKSACTHWQVMERLAQATRVALTPVTGRSHQLRVHMQWLGHPIAGDAFYADEAALSLADRLLLHAEQIAFTHPITGEPIAISSPAPF